MRWWKAEKGEQSTGRDMWKPRLRRVGERWLSPYGGHRPGFLFFSFFIFCQWACQAPLPEMPLHWKDRLTNHNIHGSGDTLKWRTGIFYWITNTGCRSFTFGNKDRREETLWNLDLAPHVRRPFLVGDVGVSQVLQVNYIQIPFFSVSVT